MFRALWPVMITLLACAAQRPASDAGESKPDAEQDALRVFVFTRTAGFRHESIPAAQAALRGLDAETYRFEFGEEPAQLARALDQSDVVAFVLTTGDVLGEDEQLALEAFVRAGGGFVGVHSAADTEYDWPFYAQLIGAQFASHPAVQPARVVREATMHPSVRFLPVSWERTDEWYNFKANPRPEVDVLLRVDEASYQGGQHGADHPIAWSHELDAGRALYTALGHTDESWSEPYFLRHIAQALLWAGRRAESGD